jgi:hypothetical protein
MFNYSIINETPIKNKKYIQNPLPPPRRMLAVESKKLCSIVHRWQRHYSLLHRGFDVLLLKIYALDGNVRELCARR